MTSNIPDNAVFVTRKDLAALPLRRFTTEMDDTLLAQLRRVLPAKLAGYCEWAGPPETPAWVRWHWYYDEAVGDFVVNAQGIESNVVLVGPDGDPLTTDALTRFALRMIRCRREWRPTVPAPRGLMRTSRPRQLAPAKAPPSDQSEHHDSTDDWVARTLHDLAQLPDAKQFSQIAKLARERFGFNHTLAMARDPRAPATIVVEDNFPPRWQEIYQRERLITIDPRLHGELGPKTWSARELHATNTAFWNVAMAHGIGSGWLMRSPDGNAALILSRADAAISDREISAIEPTLRQLAILAHQLMKRMLTNPAQHAAPRYERALPELDLEIISYLQRYKQRKEIASLMGVSIVTVDRRIAQIKKKLGVDKLRQMVDVAVRMGLVPAI